jgi:hypothetical protein
MTCERLWYEAAYEAAHVRGWYAEAYAVVYELVSAV